MVRKGCSSSSEVLFFAFFLIYEKKHRMST